jgi:hypothetical protein
LIVKVNMARKFDARSGSLCRPGTHSELMNPTALLGSLQAGLFRAVALQVKAMPQFWHPTGRLLAGPGQREHERETPGSGYEGILHSTGRQIVPIREQLSRSCDETGSIA